MTRSLCLIIAALVLSSIASAQSTGQHNMTLFDHFEPLASEAQGLNSALWGYTAPDGREYALLGTYDGVHIVDITDKPIKEVAYVWGPGSYWREIKVYKQYAYIASEARDSGSGMQIIDLSQLPASAARIRTDSSFATAHPSIHTLYIRDHYIYLMGTQPEAGANKGIIIMDLEPDPLHPRRVGQIDPEYIHDSWNRNDTLLGAAVYGEGCEIYDIHDKSKPVRLARITYPGSGTHNAEMTQDGHYVATTDEVGFTQKTLKIWDIRDLDNITLAAEYSPNLDEIVHNVHFKGRYAFVAWYTAGVHVLDMIDPPHPREVGYYDTFPGADGGFNGVWEVYPYFPSGKIIASDRQTGLYVMTFSNAVAGSISGVVRNAATNAPMPGVTITLPPSGRTVVSDAQGRYYAGGVQGEQITLATHEFGYAGTYDTQTLTGDIQKDLLLTPLQEEPVTIVVKDESGNPIDGFSYAVEPYIHSVTAGSGSVSVPLPHDSTFGLTVGKWGYTTERKIVTAASGTTVTVTLRHKYIDDATLDLGWSYSNPEDGATSGRWTRTRAFATKPSSAWLFPASQPGPGSPEGYVFMTGAEPIAPPANYSDISGGRTTLTSPLMDLRDDSDPSIWFDLWYVQIKRDTVRDTLLVQLSNDGGGSWVTAYAETEGQPGWNRHGLFPKDFLPLTDRMMIRFRASDTMSNAAIAAAVDNFEVNPTREAGVESPGRSGGTSSGMSMTVSPNPARQGAEITLQLATAGIVQLDLFNSLGQHIRSLHDGHLGAGEHHFRIDGRLPAGAYLVHARKQDGESLSLSLVVFGD